MKNLIPWWLTWSDLKTIFHIVIIVMSLFYVTYVIDKKIEAGVKQGCEE